MFRLNADPYACVLKMHYKSKDKDCYSAQTGFLLNVIYSVS